MGMAIALGLLALLLGGLGLFGHAVSGGMRLREEMIERRRREAGDDAADG